MKDDNVFERDYVFHERINKLKDEGYRGFTVTRGKDKSEGFKVVAENKKGVQLTAEGDTLDEAYGNLVELIDYTLDDV